MSPIRVGIIGLSAAAKTSWASTAHLPYLSSSEKYQITALCNSTLVSAQEAIKTYGLSLATKAYGDPNDLARDAEVDLVVCCTRVDLHYETIKPSINAGKNVYVEWPLCSKLEQAIELSSLAKEKGVRTMIGLQGRVSPLIQTIKTFLEDGKLGNVLGSSVVASGGTRSRDSIIAGLKYFTQREVGGNIVTIGFGHLIDFVHCTLGEFGSLVSHLAIQRPAVAIVDANGVSLETAQSNVPDHIVLHGILSSGAFVSLNYRRGPPFQDYPGLVWDVHGEKGELKITAPGPALQASDLNARIQFHHFATDQVMDVPWSRVHKTLPVAAQNVAALYEAFASEDLAAYPDFGEAVKRHQELETVFWSSENDKRATYL